MPLTKKLVELIIGNGEEALMFGVTNPRLVGPKWTFKSSLYKLMAMCAASYVCELRPALNVPIRSVDDTTNPLSIWLLTVKCMPGWSSTDPKHTHVAVCNPVTRVLTTQ